MHSINLLPHSDELPIHRLVACFNNTSATYKFYWLLSFIDEVEKGAVLIPKRNLFARMICSAWYTVNYFHISFGKQDLFQRRIELIRQLEQIPIDLDKTELFRLLISTTNSATLQELDHFDNQVPHWFLSPWFPGRTRQEIYVLSNDLQNLSLYSLEKEKIRVHPKWEFYLKENAALIRSFCYWRLAIYLQNKNPNVPDIPNKLIKPAKRNSLNKQRKEFWDIVIADLGSVCCIYKNRPLTIGDYAVEHFIPYSFVSHDLIWNLIPADKSFNSTKSDKLPVMDTYFNAFFQLQQTAAEIMKAKHPRNKFLEDYLTIFPNLDTEFTREQFKNRIEPLVTIAANNGFEFMQ